ncbi:MAG: hypothetical protein DWI00_16445 [Planctomycetota bacterium]|nr:MAG: hypothetical protein DWI00_16445 [Planctomycetota bacterium]
MPSGRQTVQPNEEVIVISLQRRRLVACTPVPSHAIHLSSSWELTQIRSKNRDSGNPWRPQSGKPWVSGEFPGGWAQKRWLFLELYGKKRSAE